MSDEIAMLVRSGEIRPGMTFNQRVWAITSRIPRGQVATYGQIAKALGTNAARAVGTALNRNPYAPEVPCHRVVGCDGRLVGYAHGLERKAAMLTEEGVTILSGRVDLKRHTCSL